jgi:hypothetical protein
MRIKDGGRRMGDDEMVVVKRDRRMLLSGSMARDESGGREGISGGVDTSVADVMARLSGVRDALLDEEWSDLEGVAVEAILTEEVKGTPSMMWVEQVW